MKVVSSADWRGAIPFETPMLVADLVPGDAVRCFACGMQSEPLERTELWAYKHRHPHNHDGVVRFYCRPHTPEPPRRVEPVAPARAPRARAERTSVPRKAAPTLDAPTRPLCPDCFVEVSAAGVCGMCGFRA